MFKWIKKKIVKSLVNDVVKEFPRLKDRIEGYWETNKDEIVDTIKEKVKEFILSKVGY